MTEASCVQCHRQEIYVPNAPKLAVAYATFERAGCYACHKTQGLRESAQARADPDEDQRQADPGLGEELGARSAARSRTSPGCRRSGTTRTAMQPADASAQRGGDQRGGGVSVRQQRDLHAGRRVAAARQSRRRASRSCGSIGCLGCHIIEENDRAAAGPRRTFGQPLKSVGSKTTYAWLYNWVRDPKHYNPGTYMPDLRLTDPQVADVATYLTTLTGPAGTAAPVTPTQAQADAVLLDYLRNLMPLAEAQGRLAKMDATAKQLDLGPARDRALRLLQLPRHQGLRDDAADRRRPVGRGQQARHAARLRVRRHRALEARRGSTRS